MKVEISKYVFAFEFETISVTGEIVLELAISPPVSAHFRTKSGIFCFYPCPELSTDKKKLQDICVCLDALVQTEQTR